MVSALKVGSVRSSNQERRASGLTVNYRRLQWNGGPAPKPIQFNGNSSTDFNKLTFWPQKGEYTSGSLLLSKPS